jgi:hypothetical protein
MKLRAESLLIMLSIKKDPKTVTSPWIRRKRPNRCSVRAGIKNSMAGPYHKRSPEE